MVNDLKTFYSGLSGTLNKSLISLFEQGKGRYPALDGLRAIAILLVLVFHCYYLNYTAIAGDEKSQLLIAMAHTFNWVWQGDKGVDLFFVLSGFLITMLLLKEHINTGQVSISSFYYRRAARIIPAYLLLLTAGWIIDLPNREWAWGNILFISNLQPAGTLFIPWSWSITVEAQFYILFPLLLLPLITKSRKPVLTTLSLAIISLVVRQMIISLDGNLPGLAYYEILFDPKTLKNWWDSTYIHLHTRAGPIAIGICAGAIHSYHTAFLDRFTQQYNNLNLLITSLALLLFFSTISAPIHIKDLDYLSFLGEQWNGILLGQHRNLFSLSIAILLLTAIHPARSTRFLNRFLQSKILTPIAKTSYSAYLFHILILQQTFKFISSQWPGIIGSHYWFLLGTLLTFALTFLISAACYMLVEKPFIDLSHRHHYRESINPSSDRDA